MKVNRTSFVGVCVACVLAGGLAGAADPPAPPARPTSPGVHYVYLIRHGHYDRGPAAVGDDLPGGGLSERGHRQAHLIGARLAALPVRPASLVSPAGSAPAPWSQVGAKMRGLRLLNL